MTNLDSILKSRDITLATNGVAVNRINIIASDERETYGFSKECHQHKIQYPKIQIWSSAQNVQIINHTSVKRNIFYN